MPIFVFIIIAVISYPILYIILKFIELNFGTNLMICIGILVLISVIYLIIKEIEKWMIDLSLEHIYLI